MLNVVIGLVLVFLLASLLCTTIQEALTVMRGSRGRMLIDAIAFMMTDQMPTRRSLQEWLRPFGGSSGIDRLPATSKGDFARLVLGHPLIGGMARPGRFPSYIASPAFASTLLDSIKTSAARAGAGGADIERSIAQLPDGAMRQTLLLILDEVGGDAERLRQRIETWYDDMMDRVSGWYRRDARLLSFCLGLVVAIGFNIDTIDVARSLMKDPGLAEAVAERAAGVGNVTPSGGGAGDVATAVSGLPIGWSGRLPDDGLGWLAFILVSLPGWLITAVAASLGAPFWFNLLGQFLALRSSGPSPMRGGSDVGGRAGTVNAITRPDEGPTAFEAALTYDDLCDLQAAFGMHGTQVTGVFDEQTRQAIRTAQTQFGDVPTGRLTVPLMRRLLAL